MTSHNEYPTTPNWFNTGFEALQRWKEEVAESIPDGSGKLVAKTAVRSAGAVVSAVDPVSAAIHGTVPDVKKELSGVLGSVVGGALAGAAAGTVTGGPWGTIIGGALGALIGEKAMEDLAEQAMTEQGPGDVARGLNSDPQSPVKAVGYGSKGGVKFDFKSVSSSPYYNKYIDPALNAKPTNVPYYKWARMVNDAAVNGANDQTYLDRKMDDPKWRQEYEDAIERAQERARELREAAEKNGASSFDGPEEPSTPGLNMGHGYYGEPNRNLNRPDGVNSTPQSASSPPGPNNGSGFPSGADKKNTQYGPGTEGGNGGNQNPSSQSSGAPGSGPPGTNQDGPGGANPMAGPPSKPIQSSNPNSSYPYGGNTTPDSSGAEVDDDDDGSYFSDLPILLDLDGNGVRITELSRSQKFVDAGGDGLKHRIAWAGAGDGVLFYDADGSGDISEKKEFVFSEWDPTAPGDIIGPAQRVDVITALKAMTIWPAWQHFEENEKGSIEVGKLADFVILTDDPTAIDPESLDTIKVAETIKEGVTVHAATPEELKKAWMMDPRRSGASPFSEFLRAAAAGREFRMLPAKRQTGMNRALLAGAMHDSACAGPIIAELTEAILSGV